MYLDGVPLVEMLGAEELSVDVARRATAAVQRRTAVVQAARSQIAPDTSQQRPQKCTKLILSYVTVHQAGTYCTCTCTLNQHLHVQEVNARLPRDRHA